MAKSNTHYTLQVNGENVDFVRTTKATVVAEAERVNAETREAVAVVTGTGKEVFSLKARPQRVYSFLTKPFKKVIELPEDIAALVPEDYTPAYQRPRNGAVVGRNMEAELDARYVVVATATGKVAGYAATTREAGQIMKGIKKVAAAA
jgi:hypothetical protein